MPMSEAYQKVLDQARQREQQIVSMHDGLKLTFEQIGLALGIDRGQTHFMYKRAKRRPVKNDDAPKVG